MTTQVTKTLAEFDAELAQEHINGQWLYDRLLEQLIGGPRPAGVPYLWRWDHIYARLVEACDVLPESFTARRNLAFVNPGLQRGTTHTITMGMQMLKPGEIAWAHRHSMAAIRFALQGGAGLASVVDGEVCPMEDYDLVLTPRWTWHDHENETDTHPVWLDVLDLGLVMSLNAAFYEPYGEERQPKRPGDGEYLQARAGHLRPTWERPKLDHVPHRYPWREVEAELMRLADQPGSPYDGVALEYANPMTGGPTLPTMSCWIQRLRPGQVTEPHRHTSSSVYCVVRGEGSTVVGGEELQWGRHDAFCVPNWSMHHFVNRSATDDAVLFSVNDVPALRALGLYFEEPERSLHQQDPPAVPGNLRPPRTTQRS
ncbi:MAG: 1-hydroxy-2-naphthoate dioxygenase [Actinomycetota bacterium]|jgi:1-hydroxy-2-naphthoate dioxygenase|nr:1-hydroxy-2-naphthoate dioxygenase [Actinomycetota bacterium]MDQ1500248.1 1-hydroxy-2-naphthoate dioxygenase [Actinomycetota bacterium]MDQ1502283.1 1-hydroxy-2-naphthoate dioxygenase [Actinomycetota bacterium]MDQ1566464.1 1-hydroxy-2-naphthoate dioxygenase [Actinomycetota bacterium]